MRIMGLDVGQKRIGIALSDPLKMIANPHSVLNRSRLEQDYDTIVKICCESEVEKIVVGYPLNMNGTAGPKVHEIEEFASGLEKKANINIEYWDERLSTVEAEKVLIQADVSRQKRKKVIDKLAAVTILQNYLDSRC